MRVKRRSFIQTTAAVGAAVAVGAPPLNALRVAHAAEPPIGTEPGKWISTTCQGCTTWCPAEVFVQEGRAVKVRGNQHSKQNDGTCCPRGHLGLQQVYDPDRLKAPMKRTNPEKGRGVDPGWVPISWDEALDTIADQLMALRVAGETEKYLLMRGRYTYMRDIIYDAMTKIFGSPNNISHSAICAEAEKFGPYFTTGNWDYRDYDLAKTKYVLVWGCDPLSSNRMVPAAIRRWGEVMDNATIAVVDPKFQSSAAKAHEWLAVKPGQDGALASAMAHVLLTEGLWSREFVGDFRDGENLFKAGTDVDADTFVEIETSGVVRWWNLELKGRTPEWAEGVCGVPADQIERVARGLAKAAPRAIVWLGPGACMHVRGAYSAMAIHALNGLLGSIDQEGGVLAAMKPHVKSMPDVKPYQDDLAAKHAKFEKIDQRGRKELPALKKGKSGGGVVTNNVAKGLLDKDPYEIKVAIGYMNNFPFSCGEGQRWERALAALPFFVHLTSHASEMTQFADIALPCTTSMFEKWGWVKGKQNRYGYLSLLQPVIEPIWDVRTDETEIPYLIAERLAARGFDNLLRYLQTEFKDPETGKAARDAHHFAEVATKWYTAPSWDGSNEDGDKIEGWNAFTERGVWNSEPYPYKKRWGGHFKTATHKFEFFSETLQASLTEHADKHGATVDDVLETCNYEARGELAFVPHYEAPFRHGGFDEYPFEFVDYKSRLNREGRSANSPWYHEFKKLDPGDVSGKDVLKINPVDAAKLGIADWDFVKVSTPVGTWTMQVKLWEGVRPGVVTKSYGQGHWAYGRVASKDFEAGEARGVNNNDMMPVEYDRLSGSTVRNGGFFGVRIEKA